MTGSGARPVTSGGNLLADLPERLDGERFDQLLRVANVRIERIVSFGQSTPEGEWYDQDWDEWVLVLSGAAEILVAGEDQPRRLGHGDHLFLPAHVRHRVTWTAPDQATIWLAIHITPGAPPGDGLAGDRVADRDLR